MRLFNKRKGWRKEVELLVIERENFLISLEKFNYKESHLLSHILIDYINQLLTTLYGDEVRINTEELSAGDTLNRVAIFISLRRLYEEVSAQKIPEAILVREESTLEALKSVDVPIVTPERCELNETIL